MNFKQALEQAREKLEKVTFENKQHGDNSVYICDNLKAYRNKFLDESQFNGLAIHCTLVKVQYSFDLGKEQFNYCQLVRLILLDLLIEAETTKDQ
jgi:hypothetical protein